MEIIVISILSYLMGSIPFGFILTKILINKFISKIKKELDFAENN